MSKMPSATVTVREIKNKKTGLDLSVTSHRETQGLLGKTTEYEVVVVSRLKFFKSPKHKDSDVVQYMIPRKFSDFEDLNKQLVANHPATVLPPMPKKTLFQNESVVKERQKALDAYLKAIAKNVKLAATPDVLQFLGVPATKAGKFSSLPSTVTTDIFGEDEPVTTARGRQKRVKHKPEPSSSEKSDTSEPTVSIGRSEDLTSDDTPKPVETDSADVTSNKLEDESQTEAVIREQSSTDDDDEEELFTNKGEFNDPLQATSDQAAADKQTSDKSDEHTGKPPKPEVKSLFGDPDADELDLFGARSEVKKQEKDLFDFDDGKSSDMFDDADVKPVAKHQDLFSTQDFGGAIRKGDHSDLFAVMGAVETQTNKQDKTVVVDSELDDILSAGDDSWQPASSEPNNSSPTDMTSPSKQPENRETHEKQEEEAREELKTDEKPTTDEKVDHLSDDAPEVKTAAERSGKIDSDKSPTAPSEKPQETPKPQVSSKPSTKPSSDVDVKPELSQKPNMKPSISSKPKLGQKPALSLKPGTSVTDSSRSSTTPTEVSRRIETAKPETVSKPVVGSKPSVKPKPSIKPKPMLKPKPVLKAEDADALFSGSSLSSTATVSMNKSPTQQGSMDTGDILSYIKQHSSTSSQSNSLFD